MASVGRLAPVLSRRLGGSALAMNRSIAATNPALAKFVRTFCANAAQVETKSGESMTGGDMYNWRVAAVYNALERRGKANGDLDIEDLISLGHLDQYHYLGVDACDEVIRLLGLGPNSKVLDIGSGIGGPARYMSRMSGCDITGVELQEDLTTAGTDLTRRVGLADRVRFVTGDFNELARTGDLRFQAQFDHFLSLLVFCHFPHRDETLKLCYNATKPGGTFLIEDLALIGDSFTEREVSDLHNVVCAPGVSSVAKYVASLEESGFVDIEVVDMTTPWKAWTKARHETFRDSRSETVKLHGEALFDSRCSFYEVIDRLFAGGNLGGVKITGRRPSEAEARLKSARLHGSAIGQATEKTVLNEMGDMVQDSAPAPEKTEKTETKVRSVQPLLPATDVTNDRCHDSLQYHFFFPGKFVAGRIFHTKTLQQHSAWMFDTKTGKMTELFKPSYEVMTQKNGDNHLNLESSEMRIVDGPQGGVFDAKALGLKVNFEQQSDITWLPAGQNNAVIHRPDIACSMEVDGQVLKGIGYSKRYYGPYPRFWGYRFIHGVTVDGASPEEKPSCFWTADAAFGDDKYNYYKLVLPSGEMITTEPEKTWQQDTSAYAMVNGVKHEVRLRPLCVWETVIGGPEYGMESKMQNRYCEAELIIGGVTRKAIAYNERCYGTLG